MSTAFVSAMSTPDSTRQGVKGSEVYTEHGVGDLRVTLFTQLVRGLSDSEIDENVSKIMATNSFKQIQDLVVMAFQTRDVRGGKGERDLFYGMIVSILRRRPEWSRPVLSLVPEYGCWLDLWKISTMLNEKDKEIAGAIDAVVLEQFHKDQETERPSLLAKWLPREGSKYDGLAKHFAKLFFPGAKHSPMRRYRKVIAFLNKCLQTTEINMCRGTWSQIEPTHVPGRLMKRNKLAFFNQRRGAHNIIEERYPGNADRIACAINFKEMLESVKKGEIIMKGGNTTMPHEHVAEILKDYREPSKEVSDTIQAQWDAIRAETEKAGGLGKVVPMCDFSGSMDGVPKQVSLALGILISEIATPAFRDHILTFDSIPKWHSFAGMNGLVEKVRSIGALGQGLSTDFQAACDLVLRKMVENNVQPADAPTDLLVLTDMGFDAACGNSSYSYNTKQVAWQTHFQMIRDNFARLGYTPPRIVCWNLRAEYKDYHAKAHEDSVVQLSGWSPAVLKAIQGEGVKVMTPYEGMRRLLDSERYNKVRDVMETLFNTNSKNLVYSA